MGANAWAVTDDYGVDLDSYDKTTYDFTSMSGNLAIDNTGSSYTVWSTKQNSYKGGTISVYQCTTSGLTRFAFEAVGGNAAWYFYGSNGLCNYSRVYSAALTGLKNGNIVVFVYTMPGKITFGNTDVEEGPYTLADEVTVTTQTTLYDGRYYRKATMTDDGVIGFCMNKWSSSANAGFIRQIHVYTVKGTCDDPTYRITGANGNARTFELSCSTDESKIYYSTSELASATGGTEYTGAVETNATTIWAYAKTSSSVSDVISFSTGAGSTLQLKTPSVTRTAELGVSFDSDQSSLPGNPALTYHYTLADGTTATGTSATDTKYGKVSVYVSASGYDDSEAAEFTLSPTINGDATLSFVWEVPGGEKTVAISAENTATYNDKTLGQLTYDGTEYAGLYLQSDGNWLARKNYAGLYNYTGNGNNAAYFGVSATEGQYIVIDMADGTLTANSNVEAVAGYAFNNKQYVFKCKTSGIAAFTVSKQAHIKNVYVYSPATLSVTNGYATYANHNHAVDLTNATNLIAYTATVSGDVVTFTRANNIPTGTGVLLVGEAQSVPAITGANDIENNALYAPTTAVSGLTYDQDGYYNYILTQPTGKSVGFYRANNNNVAVGKAYLRIEKGSTARQFTFIGLDGESETTGISNIQVANNAADGIYNLSGQRVAQPKKGLYIVNGKKVIVNK